MADEQRLAAIRARVDAMIPGDWGLDEVVESRDWALGLLPIRDDGGGLCCLVPNHGWPEQRANAIFIARSREDVPWLLAALDHARAQGAAAEARLARAEAER